MNKTLSNPAADLLNRVCSCFCRALREGACRQTGTHTSRLHIKHTFLKYFLKNIYFSRRTFSARRISPCWTPGCLTSKKAFFEEKQFTILPFSGWSPFSKTLPTRLQISGPSWGKTGETPMGFSPLTLGLLTRHAFLIFRIVLFLHLLGLDSNGHVNKWERLKIWIFAWFAIRVGTNGSKPD